VEFIYFKNWLLFLRAQNTNRLNRLGGSEDSENSFLDDSDVESVSTKSSHSGGGGGAEGDEVVAVGSDDDVKLVLGDDDDWQPKRRVTRGVAAAAKKLK